MLQFMEPFDQYDGQDKNLLAALNSGGYKSTGNVAIVPGRTTASRALQFEAPISRTFTTTATSIVIGFAYCAQTIRSTIVSIKDVGALEWPATLSFGSTLGVATPIIGSWYYYELVINKAAKSLDVYINDELDFSAPLPDAVQFMQDFEVTWSAANATGAKLLDDIVVIDGGTGGITSRVGPVRVDVRLPTEDVISEFSPSIEGSHFSLVDKVPPQDGAYVKSDTSGAVDTFRSATPLPDGDPIATGMCVIARKSDIDGRQLGMITGDAKGVFEEVRQTNLSTSDTFNYAVFETAPDGSKWTRATVESTPFGIAVRP